MQGAHEEADAKREQDANHATASGQGHGFHQELKADVAAARANGLAHANFPCAFGNAHEHNVHYAHTADEQADRDNPDDELKNVGHDVPELSTERFSAADAECIRLVRRYAAALPQEPANLIFGHVPHSGASLSHNEVLVVLRIVFAVGAIRNGYVIVLAVADRGIFLFLVDADHGVRRTGNLELLSNGTLIGKKSFGNIVANHSHVFAMEIFSFGVKTPVRKSERTHFSKIGCCSLKVDTCEFMVFVARRAHWSGALTCPGKDFDAHIFHRRNLLLDGHSVFKGERLAHALFRAEAGKVDPNIEAEDPEIVYAEFVERFLHVLFKAQQHGGNDNGNRHANHHTQHGQEGAHFMGANGIQRHSHIFRH